jgi:hypothetical protein
MLRFQDGAVQRLAKTANAFRLAFPVLSALKTSIPFRGDSRYSPPPDKVGPKSGNQLRACSRPPWSRPFFVQAAGFERVGLDLKGDPMFPVGSTNLITLVLVLGNGLSVAAAIVFRRWPELWNFDRNCER